MITYMDKQVGQTLKELEEDGLADNTIVFYYSDHGAGMPRSKRWLYDSSLKVPCMVRFPQKYASLAPGAPGSTTDRMVSFVDFGPTALSLAGVKVPENMQGVPFLGDQAGKPREYIYGFRDRMDERIDLIRAVRDQRFKYIRNYMPHLPWFHHQYISYMYEMPTMKAWQQLADEGKLTGDTAVFMAHTKPVEELYDTQADPDEVKNLANSPEHQETLARLRKALTDWQAEIIDLGFLPEGDLRSRFAGKAAHEVVRKNAEIYPYARISAAAGLATQMNAANTAKLLELLADTDPAVRYWAVTGLGSTGEKSADSTAALTAALQDKAPTVRVAAADALCRLGQYAPAVPVLQAALADSTEWVRLQAINVLDRIDSHALPALPALQAALKDGNNYVVRVAEHATQFFQDKK